MTLPSNKAITPEVVAKAAHLARVALTPTELADTTAHLERVHAWATALQDVDVETVAPMMHPHEGAMRLRPDVDNGQTLGADEVLADAPAQAERHFLVPRMVG